MRTGPFIRCSVCLLVLILWAVISFGIPARVQAQVNLPTTKEADLTPEQRKIEPLVRNTSAQLQARGINRANPETLSAAPQYSSTLIRVDSRARIHLYLELANMDTASLDALSRFPELGTEITNMDLKIVQVWVPYEEVETIARLDFVLRIRPPEYATFRTGSVTSQGDTILKANIVRNSLGITGAGVKVGVISDGDNNAGSSQATGDLPSTVTLFGSCDTNVTHSTCNEGTAMLEIVHDLAPGATLAMGAVSTSLDFIQRVTDLTNWGAKVIVDDVGYYSQPFFEDGSVAQAYAAALTQGIVVASSAGNAAQQHYQGLYVDSGSSGLHNFGGGDQGMVFTVPAGGSAAVFLQWSNQFGHSADDYDLYIFDSSGQNILARSENVQTGTQDPFEAASVPCNSGSPCTFLAAVRKFAGAAQTLEMFFTGNPTTHVVPADSIFGHSAVPGVISTAAISASDPGNDDIETFSSRGPSTISFPSSVQRATPAVTTIDGVTVTGAGGFSSPFYGTSAASPHAGAVAALLLQAKPTATPADVVNFLKNTVADRGTAGFDNTYGSGLVDALAAVQSALADATPPTAPSNLTATAISTSQINLSWTASTDNVGVTGYLVERCLGAGCTNFVQIFSSPFLTTFSDTGLSASTSFSYRVRATDAASNLSGYSNVASATTQTAADSTPPTAPSNLTATPISTTQLNLSWTASTDNVGVTGYLVERCQGVGCSNFAQIATPAGTTYNDTGLTAATSYSYRVRATDAAPNLSGYSNVVSATTLVAADTTPPTAPSNLTATAISTTQINLSWTASTDNVGVTGYLVERCQGVGCSNFAQIATPAGTTYNDSGLTAATSYSYRVRATDAAPNLSGYSNVASATTQAGGAGIITTVAGNGDGLTGFSDPGDGGPATSAATADPIGVAFDTAGNLYISEWSGGASLSHPDYTGGSRVRKVTPAGIISAFTGNGNPGTIAPYGIVADNAGNVAIADPYNCKIFVANTAGTLFTVAGTFSCTDSGDGGPAASAAVGNPAALALDTAGNLYIAEFYGERVRKITASTGIISTVAGNGTDAHSGDGGPAIDAAIYRPFGLAFDSAGNLFISEYSGNSVRKVTPAGIISTITGDGTNRHTGDGGPAASAAVGGPAGLAFDPAGNLYIAELNGETVRMITPAGTISTVAGIVGACSFSGDGGPATSAHLCGPNGLAFYSGNLYIADSLNNRVRRVSVAAPADTQPPTAPSNLTATPISTTQLNLSWTASTDNVGVTGYLVERCQGAGCQNFAQIATPAGTTYNDTGLTANTNYSYRVRATDAASNLSGYSNVVSATTQTAADTTPPTAPSNLTATAISTTQINLSWTASTDNVGVTGYLVERCQGAGCQNFAQIATPVATTYNDTGLTPATSYSYRVRATDAASNLSGYSTVASATTTAAATTYLVGDAFPSGSDTVGGFGDNVLNNLDLIYALRAVTQVPGFTPASCTDRFDAMDSFPLDTAGARGGDGALNNLDLIRTLRRITNIDTTRPTRAARGITPCPAPPRTVAPKSDEISTPSPDRKGGVALPMQLQTPTRAVPPLAETNPPSAALEFGPPETSDGKTKIPIYLRAKDGVSLSGLSFSVGIDGLASPLNFTPGDAAPPSLLDIELPSVLAVSWLSGLQVSSGQSLLLGDVEMSGTARTLRVFGLEANAAPDGRVLPLSWPAVAGTTTPNTPNGNDN